MKSTVRAFIAIEISAGIRSNAKKAIKPLKESFPNVKWIDDENFHVTLKFLGPNVPTTELHKLIKALERACKGVEQFDLVFEGLGAFPNPSNPRTIWIGVTDGVAELRKLAARIDAELEKLGYPAEGREFSPHLTIGRARQRDRNDDANQFTRQTDARDVGSRRAVAADDVQGDYASLTRMLYDRANVFLGSSPVDAAVLYSSELERNGPKYEPLATIELAPLGSVPDEDERNFDPLQYDSSDFKLDEEELEKHLPGVREVPFDVARLDADVEEELRAICGDAFTQRHESKSKDANSAKESKRTRAKKPFNNMKKNNKAPSSSNASLRAEIPELDTIDFSDMDAILDEDRRRGKKRFPKK